MSASPILPGGTAGTGGISDVVSQDDLTRFAQIGSVMRWLAAPLEEAPAPTAPITLGSKLADSTFKNLYAQLRSSGIPAPFAYLWAAFWAAFMAVAGPVASFIAQVAGLVVTPVGIAVLEGLGDLRSGIDPAVGILAQEVLTEFLGVEVGTSNLPLGIGGGDHLARAQAIGKLLHDQLESEFLAAAGGTVQPSTAPAQTFSGLAVNFGLASGIMGLIGGLIPYGHVDELRELGEEVANNIGLGRLVRRALTPLVTTLVSNPAQWAINIKYRPTQFKEGELVNPFLGTQLDQATLYNAMHLLGYSDDKIAAFIKMHQKRLRASDVKLLLDHGQWTENQAEDYMKTLGYPVELQPTALLIEELLEERGPIHELVTELLQEVKAGRKTVDEFTNVLQGLPYSQPTKDVYAAIATYKANAHKAARPHQLSGGELFYAFAAGIVTASDLTDRWTAQGLPAADQDIRLQLWLLHLNRLHELEQERQKAFQEKQQAFLQKLGGAKKVLSPPIPPVPPFPLG
jgi:hypothetical protein